MRHEPPVSVPMAMSHMPSAAATAAPEEEPPGTRERSAGLPGVPWCGLIPIAEKANSVMLVLAMMTAPAARSRRRIGASRVAGGEFSLNLGAGARGLTFHIEQILDGHDAPVERAELAAEFLAFIGGVGGRARLLRIEGQASARAFALRIRDARESGLEPLAMGGFRHATSLFFGALLKGEASRSAASTSARFGMGATAPKPRVESAAATAA